MKGKRVKKMERKRIFGLVMALVLTLGAVGGTIAWLTDSSNKVTNTFVAAEVSNKVNETIEKKVKKEVTVTNTGDVSAYIRAAVIINWVAADGTVTVPPADAEYSISMNNTNWIKESADGLYYYDSIVPAGATTKELIYSVEETKAPDGYHLQVTILAEAIQAEGMGDDVKTAQQAWAKAAASVNNS